MRLLYKVLAFAALLFCSLNSVAQTDNPTSLTLQQALQKAREFNSTLSIAKREIGIAETGIMQAKVIPNPELTALTEGLEKGRRTTTVQLNQVIELGGKRSSRIEVAERDQQVALADLTKQRADIRADVIGAFLDVINAQEHIHLAEASYQLAAQVNQAVKRRVAAGRVSPIEATRTSVAELTMKSELNQAQNEFTLAKIRLAALWGATEIQFATVVKPQLDETIDFSILQARLKTAPQLIRAQLEINRQQAQEELERSRRIGDVTVSIGTKREEENARTQTVLGISFPLPLFDRNQGNVLGALRKTDQARDALIATEQRLKNELAVAYQRYQSAKAELTLLQTEILPQAESAIAATVKGFEFGKFNLLDVLEAQRTLVQAKFQYLRTQADFYRSLTDIERIVGTD